MELDIEDDNFQNHYVRLKGDNHYDRMINDLPKKTTDYVPNFKKIKPQEQEFGDQEQQIEQIKVYSNNQKKKAFANLDQQLKRIQQQDNTVVGTQHTNQYIKKANQTVQQINYINKLNYSIKSSHIPLQSFKMQSQISKIQFSLIRNVDYCNKIWNELAKSMKINSKLRTNVLIEYAQIITECNQARLNINLQALQDICKSNIYCLKPQIIKWSYKYSQVGKTLAKINDPFVQAQKSIIDFERALQLMWPIVWQQGNKRKRKAGIKKVVQRKASKCRKIKYIVHPKLINFSSSHKNDEQLQGRNQIMSHLIYNQDQHSEELDIQLI